MICASGHVTYITMGMHQKAFVPRTGCPIQGEPPLPTKGIDTHTSAMGLVMPVRTTKPITNQTGVLNKVLDCLI